MIRMSEFRERQDLMLDLGEIYVRTVTWLGDLEISSCPLLQQGRKQSTGNTDHEAQEPKGIHPNRIGWRRKRGGEAPPVAGRGSEILDRLGSARV